MNSDCYICFFGVFFSSELLEVPFVISNCFLAGFVSVWFPIVIFVSLVLFLPSTLLDVKLVISPCFFGRFHFTNKFKHWFAVASFKNKCVIGLCVTTKYCVFVLDVSYKDLFDVVRIEYFAIFVLCFDILLARKHLFCMLYQIWGKNCAKWIIFRKSLKMDWFCTKSTHI